MSALPSLPAETPAPQPDHLTPRSNRWHRIKPHLVAVLITFHLVSTGYYVLPYPPYFDERTLALPEVRDELSRFFGNLHRLAPVRPTADELQRDTLKFVKWWMGIYFAGRKMFEPYMEAAGITQSWNMFGGTPPRHPRVMVIEVLPAGESEFVQWLDLRWGTPESDAMDFRHRKTHEVLGLVGWDRQRENYAQWWGKQWSALHPDRPAARVRLSYLRYTTPGIDDVRATGVVNRKPTPGVNTFVWDMKP